ncbi:IgGFc-binding protein-like isoform X2 [Mytilus trossulus]|uniref:IgGFc-binding protein-like isoform X2 n=1 Tax=Mytilus trossulus TaxID=6551 RepID=UPI003006362A
MLPACDVLLCFLFLMTAYGNTLTIGSTVNSTLLDSEIFKGLTINSSCATAYQCKGKLVCTDGQCKCSDNYIWNGTSCIEEKTFYSKCKLTAECDATLFCIYGTCQCAQMFYWNGNVCVSEKTVNDTCTNSKECGGKLLCEDGVCQCLVDLFWNGNICIFKNFDGHSCESSVECAENLECRESICQCSESEYWDISKCYTKKSINDKCMEEKECSETLHCDINVCQCANSNYWTGSTCSIKKDENSFCNASIECKATLQCRHNHCICCDQDYWNGQVCEGNICAVEHCMNGGKCQISGNRHLCKCGNGYLGDKCQYAEGRGKDFIVIFHEAHGRPSPRILPAIYRKSEINIFYFANNKNVSVTLNSADNTYTLDSNVLMTNGLHQAGAEIHSTVPIILYGFLFLRRYHSEGFLVIPTRYVSTDYVIPSFTPYDSNGASLFSLTSVYSNTLIEINFTIKDGSVSYENIQYSNNQTLTLVLNKYTAFQVMHSSDLTGTRIFASKPVAVVSGNRCNYINAKADCQPFIEMVLPTNQLDNVYVIPYIHYRPENTVRVLAVNDTNIALKSGNNRTRNVLKSRDFMDYFHTTISYISSESDVMVHIYPHELSQKHGDAFMMTIPGINQYLYDYDFIVPPDFESFISITVPTEAVDGFVLDGSFVNLKNIFSISGEEYHYSSFSIPISNGSHHITHREKTRFGLWIYGNFTDYESYGYSAGMAFKT